MNYDQKRRARIWHRLVAAMWLVGFLTLGAACGSDDDGRQQPLQNNSPGNNTPNNNDPNNGHADVGTDDIGGEDIGGDDVGDDSDTGGGENCPTRCSEGLTSCDGNAVRTCVRDGECTTWSDPVACEGSEVCSGGRCASECTDVCVVGAKECSGGQVRECVTNAGGCADWSTPAACDGDTVCSGGECVESCTDACTQGATRCAGANGVETCEMQATGCLDWSQAEACTGGGVCQDGECGGCLEGTERCGTSGSLEQCQGGDWHAVQSCPFGCANGECATSVSCAPGHYRCNGKNAEVCNAGGTAYLHVASCAVGCNAGLCTGACEPGVRRCNGLRVEQCNAGGTAWETAETCTTFCDQAEAICALDGLEITTNTELDGVVVVDGPVVVRSGATLNSPAGDLTIRASSITVELGASITASPTGRTPAGQGGDGTQCSTGSIWRYGAGGGGGYGTIGNATPYCSSTGPVHGRVADVDVTPGSAGGTGYNGGVGGSGGGVIRLIASTIELAGQVSANGQAGGDGMNGGGGGSGGGILIAADNLTISGSVTTSGGAGGAKTSSSSSYYAGGAGGNGRVKLLYGASRNITGNIIGSRTESLMPPLTITSSTHPDPALVYNDDFDVVAVSWERSFPSVQAYYHVLNAAQAFVPTPANGTFVAEELAAFERDRLQSGPNYFHLVPVSATSVVGTAENRFRVSITTTPPAVTSSSHPNQTTWSDNRNAFFAWTLPHPDHNFTRYYYVLDQFGETVPTAADTALPVDQKQIIRSNLPDGIWAFHIVAADTQGYLTRQAGHYRVRIGPDPGAGTLLGNVVDQTSAAVPNATLTINRGLLRPQVADQVTNAAGSFNFASLPAGSWELRVSAPGFETKYVTVEVRDGQSTTSNINLSPL